jgi:hypothetical protein
MHFEAVTVGFRVAQIVPIVARSRAREPREARHGSNTTPRGTLHGMFAKRQTQTHILIHDRLDLHAAPQRSIELQLHEKPRRVR